MFILCISNMIWHSGKGSARKSPNGKFNEPIPVSSAYRKMFILYRPLICRQ